MASYYNSSECNNTMASLDDVLAAHVLDWIYNDGFEEVTIPDEVPEAILNGVILLESVCKSDSTCKNNGRVVTM